MLRTLTNLHAEIGNATRWKSWGTMVMKHQRIRDHIIEGSQHYETNYKNDTSLDFWRKFEVVKSIFEDIDIIAVSMQTRMYKLSQCRNDLDTLLL